MPDISKTAQAIKYFAQQYQSLPGHKGIPRKRLVKMLYMADLLAREYLDRPISVLEYYRDEFGPYDRAVKDFISELIDSDLANERVEWDNEYEYKRLVDAGQPIVFEFTRGEYEVLRYVAANYLAMPMEELLRDVVYRSPPMQGDPPEGKPLNMDMVNGLGTRSVGFDLEDVLQAEEEVASGKFASSF